MCVPIYNHPMDPLSSASVAQLIVEQSPDAVIFADVEGAIRIWNRRAEEVFGYLTSEVLGQSLDIIIPERLRERHWQGFDAAVRTGATNYAGRVLTTRSIHKDGRTLYVDLGFALVKDHNGNVLGALATARDITQRYLEEKAARERRRQA